MVRNFTNSIIRGQGPVSPTNFFPAWLVKLFLREVTISEACIGELLVSYIPGSKQESIPYPFK